MKSLWRSVGPARRALAYGLMVASGFAGLAYQIVWTRQSTAWLGHESAAVLAVVAAFFGGLACGALLLGSRVERSPSPARWYAGCEVAIGAWSLAIAVLLKSASSGMLALIGPQPSPLWHWSVAFLGTFLLLLPATMAMGATLPAMERVLAGDRGNGSIGALYGFNTFGAVLGVLGAAFWLVPHLGLMRTAAVCAALNVVCAGAALLIARAPERTTSRATATRSFIWLAPLAVTGFLGIGYEVLAVRALSQVAENTVYTFAILLAVYLVGTALGAGAHARWLVNRFEPASLRDRLLQGLAASCLLGALSMSQADDIKGFVLHRLGAGLPAALAAESVLAAIAFLPPTVLMGAVFSQLSTSARSAGIGFGRAIGVNTLGAALAPLFFSVLLVPLLGLGITLLMVVCGYLLLISATEWRGPRQWALVAATLACMAWGPSLTIVTLPEGGRLLAHLEGVMAAVSVVEDSSGSATLHIDNRQQEGSSATLLADARQALLPILLHPSPRRALFLGVGTGLTASSATIDPALQVDAIELVPEVIVASAHFAQSDSREADRSRVTMMSADARRYVRTARRTYDVIVSDNFHPARSGSGSLYTVEHFELVRSRLAPGGLFCQWLPLHQLDLATLRSIVRSFQAAYPSGSAVLATHSLDTPVVGLIASRNGERFDLERIRSHMQRMPAHSLEHFGVGDDLALFGSFIAGPRALTRFASEAPLNTDDHPVVAYRAPEVTYAPDSQPRERLMDLLSALNQPDGPALGPGEILVHVTARHAARLSAYWTARNRFIEAGRAVRPSGDVREMLAQVRGPLLSVLQVSPDFRPAYDPLLRMATALSNHDPAEARTLLSELRDVQPLRPEAGEKLRELAAASR